MIKRTVFALAIMAVSASSFAKLPELYNGSSSVGDLHIESNSVYLNGKPCKVKKLNDNFYEARRGKVVISISINGDQVDASWTGQHRANGMFAEANN